MKRLLSIVSVALLFSVRPAEAWNPVPNAVTWKVDHSAREITVTARLYLYPEKYGQWITPRMRQQIKDQIEGCWRGHTYRCYRLIVQADVVSSDDGTPVSVPEDRVGVRIVKDGLAFRSFVTPREKRGDWNSPHSSDRRQPLNNPDYPASWFWPPTGASAYAHEFGHVLGLADAYIEWVDPETGKAVTVPRPFMEKDLMATSASVTVSQQTVDLLVRRGGAVKDSELRCGYRVKYDRGPVHVRGHKCGGPEGAWTLKETMETPAGLVINSLTLSLEIGSNLRGTWRVAVTDSVPAVGVSASRSGGGTVVFDRGPPPTLEILGLQQPLKITLETDPPECAGK